VAGNAKVIKKFIKYSWLENIFGGAGGVLTVAPAKLFTDT